MTDRLPTDSPLSWAAGVLDACGRFRLRLDGGGATVRAVGLTPSVAIELERVLGGKYDGRTTSWFAAASEQAEVLQRVVPYLRIQAANAAAVIQWRIAQPAKRVGLSTPLSIKTFRNELVAKVNVDRASDTGKED